ncbi:hypothetical protein ONA00_00165 [Mycoplasmopsis cynos]|uniref:hypothetical protein n=1 Tax=Mycoplasmopsis cynos TaxID=171284 RepID=UPI0024C72CD8|nr:hypothetical protein [Mycoplasmopsis cynos]WAM10971.1 hypothetical protein ONA00_00165 [Mycoplasmopsis cynos]
MKNKLINLYENTYKDKVYEKRLEKYNETINKWKEYRQKIKDGTITLEDYTNRKNFKHYLTYFLEFDSLTSDRQDVEMLFNTWLKWTTMELFILINMIMKKNKRKLIEKPLIYILKKK